MTRHSRPSHGLPSQGSFTILHNCAWRRRQQQQQGQPHTQADSHSGRCPSFRLLEVPKELEGLFEEAARGRAGKRTKRATADDVARDACQEGTGEAQLIIRGLLTDEAVLCTASQTFTVKERQTSNSLLVCARRDADRDGAGSQLPHLVLDVQSALLECTQRVPRLAVLDDLLGTTAYDGSDRERELRDSGARFYGPDDLEEVVQASTEEIKQGLAERGALLMNGYHRVLSQSCTREMLDFVLTTSVADGIPLQEFSIPRCLEAARREAGIVEDERILEHVVRLFSKQPSSSDVVVSICEERVTKFMAEWILCRDPNKVWLLDEFMGRWEDALPETFRPDIRLLKNLAIIEPADPSHHVPISSKSKAMTLRYFPRSALSPTAALRFQELFLARPRWPAAEIRPYLEDIEVSPKKVDALLLKYARSVKDPGGGLVYTSRVKGT